MPDVLTEGELFILKVKGEEHQLLIEVGEVRKGQGGLELVLSEVFFQGVEGRLGRVVFIDQASGFRTLAQELRVLLLDLLEVSHETRLLVSFIVHFFIFTRRSSLFERRIFLCFVNYELVSLFSLSYLLFTWTDELQLLLHLLHDPLVLFNLRHLLEHFLALGLELLIVPLHLLLQAVNQLFVDSERQGLVSGYQHDIILSNDTRFLFFLLWLSRCILAILSGVNHFRSFCGDWVEGLLVAAGHIKEF